MNGKDKIQRVFIGLGSNIEPRHEYIKLAIDKLKEVCKVVQQSSILETKPMGFESDTHFLNLVVEVETSLSPRDLMEALKAIEREIGRKNKSQEGVYESRKIDLDILYFGTEILITPDLVLPHPRLYEREFVLKPLVEIAPDFLDPMRLQSIEELLIELKS